MKLPILIALLLVVTTASQSQTLLPDKPLPRERKEFLLDVAALSVAWSSDAVSTAHAWQRCSTCYEIGGLEDGSRSVPKVMGAWAGVDIGLVVAAYEWKDHVHNRYLHPLWRAPLLWGIQNHYQGVFNNWKVR